MIPLIMSYVTASTSTAANQQQLLQKRKEKPETD
jgi:hypothetical protein